MERALGKSLGQKGYQDLRWEDLVQSSIHFKGRELHSTASNRERGGLARVLTRGGWGTFAFSDIDNATQAINRALMSSEAIPGSTRLAPAPTFQERINARSEKDPRGIALAEKKDLLEHYNQLILSYPDIQSTEARYYEINREKYFFNNEGTDIYQEQLLTGIVLRIIARRDNIIQRTSLALGGSPHYNYLLDQEEKVKEKVRETLDLLEAEPVKGGTYNVILDPECTGVFIHEAFGHLSESDNLANNPTLQQVMVMDREFGPSFLNVIDDPTIPDVPGHFIYDDEGVPGKKTHLIKDGKLMGRLHSRETAGKLEEDITGNCRAQDFSFPPLVRMTTTFIDNGPHDFQEMLAGIDDGLYLKGAAGGQTSGDYFTFGTQVGYRIKNGKIGPMVRDATLSGNLFTTLKNIERVGNDLSLSRSGGCGKGGQILVDVGHGAPHVQIREMAIGGR